MSNLAALSRINTVLKAARTELANLSERARNEIAPDVAEALSLVEAARGRVDDARTRLGARAR